MQERNVLFKNEMIPSVENFRKMYFHYFLLRPSAIVIFTILASYFIFATAMVLYFVFAFGVLHINYTVTGGIFLLLLIYRPIQYFSYVRSAASAFGDSPEPTVLYITDGEILNDAGIAVFSIRSARRAYVTKDIIYLLVAGKRIIFLCRAGFAGGKEAEFIAYLKSRNISVSGR